MVARAPLTFKTLTPASLESNVISLHPPKLLDQMHKALRSRHYNRSTEQTYCQWIRHYIHLHHIRHPAEMADPYNGLV